MTDVADRYKRRAGAFEALITRTAPEQWSNPSPCAGWLALDIVTHIVEHSAQTLRDHADVHVGTPPPTREDPRAAFRWARRAVERVLDDPATPDAVMQYLDAALSFDLPQHWWDLAKATGQDATMDPREVEFLWAALSPMRPAWWQWQRDNGHYAPAVHIPEDAPLQDRVLGLIGREPHWMPRE